MKEFIVAKTAGYCFGVNRAVKLLFELAEKETRPIVTLGPVIHNPQFMERIKSMGIKTVDTPDELPKGCVAVVRTHGVPLSVRIGLDNTGIDCADLTCPFVKKIHEIVSNACNEGKHVLVAGDSSHPEVIGIRGHCQNGMCSVVADAKALLELTSNEEFLLNKYIIVAQTTYNTMEWKKICEIIQEKHYTNITVFDTICYASEERQNEAAQISSLVDLMLVVGGKNSSNTTKLYDICKKRCQNTFHIESIGELPLDKLRASQKIGLTAGASTPDDIIKEVVSVMTETDNSAVTAHEEITFEEALEQSLKTVRRGDVVRCTIVSVQPNEIQVDLGTKHTGIIPVSEISEEDFTDSDLYKPGQEIEAQVLKVNDQEGTITLSKKKLDAQKEWATIEDSKENNTPLSANISNAVNGGVIVNFKGIRVFIPASQASLSRNTDLESLVGTNAVFKIIEIDRRRRRVIGSIRAVLAEQKKAFAEKTWDEMEIGKHMTGIVKSLTSFGAFVDIGGVDGMVHISELSWDRIRHPSEVVNIGQTVEVYIKDFDRDANRISLGYKKAEDNPWFLFTNKYNTGDTAEVKILKLMKYGAFAQIIEGVDGLIHISRIADRHIEKVSDMLRVNDIVKARIVDIDEENQKVSLSIRILLEDGMRPEDVFISGMQAEQLGADTESAEPSPAAEAEDGDSGDEPASAPESGKAGEDTKPAEPSPAAEAENADSGDDPASAPESGKTGEDTKPAEPATVVGAEDVNSGDDPASAPESGKTGEDTEPAEPSPAAEDGDSGDDSVPASDDQE